MGKSLDTRRRTHTNYRSTMHRLFQALVIAFILVDLMGKWSYAAVSANKSVAELRKEIAASPEYDPYELQFMETERVDQSKKLWKERRFDEAYKVLFDLLDDFPASIMAIQALQRMSDSLARNEYDPVKRKKAHMLFGEYMKKEVSIRNAILSSGDGKSPTTAYWVLTINEEYYLLNYLDYECKEQALLPIGDKKYDELKTVGQKGDLRSFFFDVSHFSRKDLKKEGRPAQTGNQNKKPPAATVDTQKIIPGDGRANTYAIPPPKKMQTETVNPHPFRPRQTQ